MSQNLGFDWLQYLLLAEQLAEGSKITCDEEAILRTAINRAYYAAFKKAEEFLVRKGEINLELDSENDEERGNSHWKVIQKFLKSSNRNRKNVGKELRRIKFNRESADYYAEFRGDLKRAVEDTLLTAASIIKALRTLV